MSTPSMGSLILFTPRLAECRRFYETLGLPLEEESHEEGPIHHACELGGVHFALFEATNGEARRKAEGGATMTGFTVDAVDEVFAALKPLSPGVIWEPGDAPWGRTAQLQDPDGRPVELFERRS